MSKNVHIVYKNPGETPLECLKSFRQAIPEYSTEKMTYAGRLDPLAEGLLIILVGDGIKEKERYLSLGKEYEVEIIFGFSTDTFDVLGKVAGISENLPGSDSGAILQKFLGKRSQKYPPFSSKTVKGEHLHSLSRAGKMSDEELPERQVEIYSLKMLQHSKISGAELLLKIENGISKVKGDFRQEEILGIWREKINKKQFFPVWKISVSCGSGTYMRRLADEIGLALDTHALALSIKRTKIGEYGLRDVSFRN
ncbi:MAG: hypothetical protein Q8P86_01310 [bacterium]|nr:hypothetical protein [bacterium]